MNKTIVDINQLNSVAALIDEYIDSMHLEISNANSTIESLMESWNGVDAIFFRDKWTLSISKGSTYNNMIEVLSEYSNLLKLASKKYKETQKACIKMANDVMSC